jgi:hypothetical protein
MKIKNNLDLENSDKKYNLQKISESEIKVLSVDDFWDGPLSGTCLWQDKTYYYQCFDQLEEDGNTDRWPRKYVLLNLTDEQMSEIEKLQEKFDKSAGSEKLRKEYIKLYEDAPEQIIEKDQIIAWFESNRLGKE